MLNSTLYYAMIAKDYSKSLANAGTSPTAERETAYFQANIGNVKTIDDLMKNGKLYNYVMTAFGLADMAYAKGLVRRFSPAAYQTAKASLIR